MEKFVIKKKYIEHLLEEGKEPITVFAFAKKLKMSESDFYNYYASFEAIEKDFWASIFIETKMQLEVDQTYIAYSAKEKLLSFYYLWIQKLREFRSYVNLLKDEKLKMIPMNSSGFDEFKKHFLKYADEIIGEAIDKKEITFRKFISDRYKQGIWLQTLFVLNYWIKDNSENFEMTDAAIEKAVNLSFKLFGDSVIDNVIDFGKFMMQKAV
ncbi:MAG: TetR/AcrR family transcriptional regulator [Cytophagales bacterium]